MNEPTDNEIAKKKRERSPSYPAIDLKEALDRARTLYDEERRNAAPVNTILKHWGYAAGSGNGLRVLAALDKFGLTADEGSGPNRKARLTEDAHKILIDERPDSQERQRLIQKAALRPTIHSDLWEQYKADLPSDGTLKFGLRQKGFTEEAAQDLIDEYKATVGIAELGKAATLAQEYEDKREETEEGGSSNPRTLLRTPRQMTVPAASTERQLFQFPVSWSRVVAVETPFPLTTKEWDQFMAILTAMKPSIAPDETEEDDSEHKPQSGD